MLHFVPIAVLIDTSDAVGRQFHRGIFRYARPGKAWKIYTDLPTPDGARRAAEWEPRGVIGRIAQFDVARRLRRMGCPVVNVDDVTAGVDLPHVGKDEEAIGRMAAEHLIERGFQNFAAVGTTAAYCFAHRRERAFVARLAAAGRACEVYRHEGGWPTFFSPRKFWEREGRRLIDWIAARRAPLAVFAYTDLVGRWLIDLCAQAQIHVPDQVAVISAENDDLICQSAYPPLSAVAAPIEEIGFAAARLLDRMMRQHAHARSRHTTWSLPSRRPIYIAPHAVAARLSTDTLAVDDAEIARALRIIRDSAGRPLDVKQLLQVLPVSRRTLEKRFRRAIGRTPRQEIERVAVQRAMRLLAETDLPMKRVGLDSGFSSAVRFAITFRRSVGMTPSTYRARHLSSLSGRLGGAPRAALHHRRQHRESRRLGHNDRQ